MRGSVAGTDIPLESVVYLDNAATTRARPEAVQTMAWAMTQGYGNPSSTHRMGARAQEALEKARRSVARLLGADPSEIIFTGSATEANNMALLGAARGDRGGRRHVVVGAIEHPSVLEPAKVLAAQGFEVTIVPVDGEGLVDPQAVAEALRPDTLLVSVMAVNNEMGALEPVSEIARRVRAKDPMVLVHSDLVQAAGRIPIDVHALGVDLASVSAHKLHGPKGVGALFVRRGVALHALVHGGGQEHGMRSGTENVPGAVGFGVAADKALESLPAATARLYDLQRRLRDGLSSVFPRVHFLGPPGPDRRAPHILAAAFEGIRAQVLAGHLDELGVMVSTGSACSSHRSRTSHVLQAMGLPPALAEATVRFSLGLLTTQEEVDRAVEAVGICTRELVALFGQGGRSHGRP